MSSSIFNRVILLAGALSMSAACAQSIEFVDIACFDQIHSNVAIKIIDKNPEWILAEIIEDDISEKCYAKSNFAHKFAQLNSGSYKLLLSAEAVKSRDVVIQGNVVERDFVDGISSGTYKISGRIGKEKFITYSINESFDNFDLNLLGFYSSVGSRLINGNIASGNHAAGLFSGGFTAGAYNNMRGYHYSSIAKHVGPQLDQIGFDPVHAFSQNGSGIVYNAAGEIVRELSIADKPGIYDISSIVANIKAGEVLRTGEEAFSGKSNIYLKDATGVSAFVGQRNSFSTGWENFYELIGPVYKSRSSIVRLGFNSDGPIVNASLRYSGAVDMRSDVMLNRGFSRVKFNVGITSMVYQKSSSIETMALSSSVALDGIRINPVLLYTKSASGSLSKYIELNATKSFRSASIIAGIRKFSNNKPQVFAGMSFPIGGAHYQVEAHGKSIFGNVFFKNDDVQGQYSNFNGKSHLRVMKEFASVTAGFDANAKSANFNVNASWLRHDGQIKLQKNLAKGKNGYLYVSAPYKTRLYINGVYVGITDSKDQLITSAQCGRLINVSVDDSESPGVVQGSLSQMFALDCLTGHDVKFDY